MKRTKAERPAPEESLDARKDAVLGADPEVTENDAVFQNIIRSIENGWEGLDDQQKREVLDGFADLVQRIKTYHDSYTRLKGVSKFRLSTSAGLVAVKRYQEEMTEADKVERILHNSFMDSVNILARTMKKAELDIAWYTDRAIYDADHATMRTKLKHWMFKVFAEREE